MAEHVPLEEKLIAVVLVTDRAGQLLGRSTEKCPSRPYCLHVVLCMAHDGVVIETGSVREAFITLRTWVRLLAAYLFCVWGLLMQAEVTATPERPGTHRTLEWLGLRVPLLVLHQVTPPLKRLPTQLTVVLAFLAMHQDVLLQSILGGELQLALLTFKRFQGRVLRQIVVIQ